VSGTGGPVGVEQIILVDPVALAAGANDDLDVLRALYEAADDSRLRVLIVGEGIGAPEREQILGVDGSDTCSRAIPADCPRSALL
jgi:hypothetical protein